MGWFPPISGGKDVGIPESKSAQLVIVFQTSVGASGHLEIDGSPGGPKVAVSVLVDRPPVMMTVEKFSTIDGKMEICDGLTDIGPGIRLGITMKKPVLSIGMVPVVKVSVMVG